MEYLIYLTLLAVYRTLSLFKAFAVLTFLFTMIYIALYVVVVLAFFNDPDKLIGYIIMTFETFSITALAIVASYWVTP